MRLIGGLAPPQRTVQGRRGLPAKTPPITINPIVAPPTLSLRNRRVKRRLPGTRAVTHFLGFCGASTAAVRNLCGRRGRSTIKIIRVVAAVNQTGLPFSTNNNYRRRVLHDIFSNKISRKGIIRSRCLAGRNLIYTLLIIICKTPRGPFWTLVTL
jgi:hypothetical protein